MINLKDFCSKNQELIALVNPFVYEGYEYATDGYICVRVKTDKPNTPADIEFPKSTPELFNGIDKAQFEKLLPTPKTNKQICGCVNGYVPKVCNHCEGTGRCICEECDTEHECGYCYGEGQLPTEKRCPICKGKGFYFTHENIKITDNKTLKSNNLEQILTLPNPMYSKEIVKNHYMFFKFDGGEGIVSLQRYF